MQVGDLLRLVTRVGGGVRPSGCPWNSGRSSDTRKKTQHWSKTHTLMVRAHGPPLQSEMISGCGPNRPARRTLLAQAGIEATNRLGKCTVRECNVIDRRLELRLRAVG